MSKRILIIEDDTELCEEMVELLTAEGFTVEYAQDAVEGEKLIRTGSYDIILVDYKMPLLSGVDILKNLKADHIKKRIFLVSGRPSTGQALKDEGVSDMVSGILTKPIDFELLVQKIKES